MEAKKISFGFSKVAKKPNLLPTKENVKTEAKVELIKCLEGQEIKLVEEQPEKKPLVIPLKESQKTSAALASLMKRRAVLLGEEESEDVNSEDPNISLYNEGPEDIEKQAAREILAEVQKNDSVDPGNNLVLPVVKPEDLPLEGATESTLDDYESIPIQDFGKAMLRGMGWIEPLPKKNKKGGPPLDDTPAVRPKGMGLGADKALKKMALLVAPEPNEVLEIKRNAYVLILGGKHKDLYGQIEGFDDHAGRVIVKLALGGAKEAFNEFLCQPVSRKEYLQYGKCINSSKYEEYKKKENEYGQIILGKPAKPDKNERSIKKERIESIESKLKRSGDYERNHCCGDYKEDKKDVKREKEGGLMRAHDKYENENGKETSNEYRNRKKESGRYDIKDHQQEHGNYTRSKGTDIDDYKNRNSRSCELSSRYRDRQQERSMHNKINDGYEYRKKQLDDFSDSESDSYSSIHNKSKKSKLKKKSKKSKKSKYKSSDSDMSSSSRDSSSDSEHEKYRKHKKKTKKSKKQREHSRGRR